MFIFNDKLVKIFTLGIGNYTGITIFPFVFAKESMKNSNTFKNHESIHIRQQIEMLVIFFYLWYGIEFLIRLIRFKSWKSAYSTISFENEAYSKQGDKEYLKNRKFWNFLKFF